MFASESEAWRANLNNDAVHAAASQQWRDARLLRIRSVGADRGEGRIRRERSLVLQRERHPNVCRRLTPEVELWSACQVGAAMLTLFGWRQAHNLMPVAPSAPTDVRRPGRADQIHGASLVPQKHIRREHSRPAGVRSRHTKPGRQPPSQVHDAVDSRRCEGRRDPSRLSQATRRALPRACLGPARSRGVCSNRRALTRRHRLRYSCALPVTQTWRTPNA